MTNNQLQTLIIFMFLIISAKAFFQVLKTIIYNLFWHSQISGDDEDEEAYDINQENPFYYE